MYHEAQLQYVSSNDTVIADGNINGTTTTPSSTSSPLAGIQIAYPNEWLVNDLGNGTVRFFSPLRTDLMRFTVNVVDLPSSMNNITLDNLVELNLNTSRQQLSNFSLLESNATTISSENQSAYRIIYTNTNKDPNFPLKFKTMQVFAIKDGQLYTLSYVSEDSQYGRYLPTIENMIDSITFTKKMVIKLPVMMAECLILLLCGYEMELTYAPCWTIIIQVDSFHCGLPTIFKISIIVNSSEKNYNISVPIICH